MIIWQTLKVTSFMLALFTLSNVAVKAPTTSAGTTIKFSLGHKTIEFRSQDVSQTSQSAFPDSAPETLADTVAIALSQSLKADNKSEEPPTTSQPTSPQQTADQRPVPVD